MKLEFIKEDETIVISQRKDSKLISINVWYHTARVSTLMTEGQSIWTDYNIAYSSNPASEIALSDYQFNHWRLT